MIGRHISHFYVIRALGSGGMGVVYEAQDTRLPRSVALKFLRPSLSRDVDAVRRFKREARMASSLNHPNICTILEVDEIDGQSFLAMELLQGRSLRERVVASAMSADELVDVALQVADALATAHDKGIMHRDITPGNIFITDTGPVKLLDFGLAKHFPTASGAEVSDDLTQPGSVAGTIHYMAPEQFAEGAASDHRSDLFSFGAVLYHMATGARPFEAKSKLDVVTLIQEQPHIPIRRLAPHHPVALELIIDRLLAKQPEARYASAWELHAALEAVRRRGVRPQSQGRIEAERRTSLAVLPFHIVGAAGPFTKDFRDGLAEDISGHVSRLPGVHVASRTSTRYAASRSISDIGQQLGARFVLEGTIQEADGALRVLVNVVDTSSQQSICPAIRVERTCDRLLDVQDDVARQIVDAVAGSLPASHRRHTQDPEAYNAYKRGQHYWKGCYNGGWRAAIEQFQYAVERDPRFADGHVALGAAYNFLGFYCLMKPNLAFSVARRSLKQALELDDTSSVAHSELALVKFGGDWDWEGAEREFRQALRLDPRNAAAHVYYAWLLMLLGRGDAAFAEGRTGFDQASSSLFVRTGWAQTLYLARRCDEAIDICSQCLAVNPKFAFARHLRGQCYELKSMYREAVADLEYSVTLTNRTPFHLGMLGHCYGKAGMRAEALALIAELDRQARETYVPPQSYVYVYSGLDQKTKALEYQERAYEDGAPPFNYLAPNIRELYALDPHHKSRLEQMRLIL